MKAHSAHTFDTSTSVPSVKPRFEFGVFYTIHPSVRYLWIIGSILSWFFLVAMLAVFSFIFGRFWNPPLHILIPAVALVFLGGIAFSVFMSYRQYDRWRFKVSPEEFTVELGVITQQRKTVPRLRIQHVDISSGPIDRMFGLTQLSVYTAGSIAPVIRVPGLRPDEAEDLRRELLFLKT
jgi:membrane protein YdbS with pleckstrin-like domain